MGILTSIMMNARSVMPSLPRTDMSHRIEREEINMEGSERIEITTRQLMKDGSVKVETIECDSYIIFLEKTRMINDGQIHVSSGCAGPSQSLLNIVDGLPQMIKVMADVIGNLSKRARERSGCGQERTH